MQVCNSLQTDNHASTPPLSFLQAGCPSCRTTNSVKALKAIYVERKSKIESKVHYTLEPAWDTALLHCNICCHTETALQQLEQWFPSISDNGPKAICREVCVAAAATAAHLVTNRPSSVTRACNTRLVAWHSTNIVWHVNSYPTSSYLTQTGSRQSPSCDCGQRQTTNHIVDTCPLTKFEGGLNPLHKAVIWLESTATAALAK